MWLGYCSAVLKEPADVQPDNELMRFGRDRSAGLESVFHPSSPPGSQILLTEVVYYTTCVQLWASKPLRRNPANPSHTWSYTWSNTITLTWFRLFKQKWLHKYVLSPYANLSAFKLHSDGSSTVSISVYNLWVKTRKETTVF